MSVGFHDSARHAFIDQSVEQASALLADPRVQANLGHIGLELTAGISQLFVPNIRNGELSIPAEHVDSNKYPIVAICAGEKLTGPILAPSPEQLIVADNAFEAMRPINKTPQEHTAKTIVEFMSKYKAYSSVDNATGRCETIRSLAKLKQSDFRLYFDELRQVISRPMILLNHQAINASRADLKSSPLIVAHELVHVRQAIKSMMKPYPNIPLSHEIAILELEANNVVAHMLYALMGGYVQKSDVDRVRHLQNALTIEGIRSQHAIAGDPYGINYGLVEGLRQKRLTDAVFQKHERSTTRR